MEALEAVAALDALPGDALVIYGDWCPREPNKGSTFSRKRPEFNSGLSCFDFRKSLILLVLKLVELRRVELLAS